MVYASLDWFTAMLRNISVREVYETLKIYEFVYEDSYDDAYRLSLGYNDNFVFSSNNVNIFVSWSDYMGTDDSLPIVEQKFSKVRLDITGSGLRFIRSVLPDPLECDRMLSDINLFGDHLIHVTRVDFAYDFVNLFPSFISDFATQLNDLRLDPKAPRSDSGALADLGVEGGKNGQSFKYELKLGSSIACIYLGTKRSNRMVRLYDKKLEMVDKNGAWRKSLEGLIPSFPHDENINTWFRIEIECRYRWAHEYLFNMNGNQLSIIRHLFDTCKVKDPRTNQVFPAIKSLFNWSELPSYLCILHFTELVKPVTKRIDDQLNKSMTYLLLLFSLYGYEGINSRMEERVFNMNFPQNPRQAAQNLAFRKLLTQLKKERPKKKLNIDIDETGNIVVKGLWRSV